MDSESSSSDSDFDDEDDLLFILLLQSTKLRSTPLYRKRWDANFFVPLASLENSFVSEYRMDYRSFDLLVGLLSENSLLNMNEEFARRAVPSAPISVASRVGSALILLGGGRITEAMRTHGIAMSTAYDNLARVVRAINLHPALAISCDNSTEALVLRALSFRQKSSDDVIKFCTGVIDGLCISISPRKVRNQTQYFSGGKQKFCVNMQGVCDSNGLFIAVTCKHVGSTNDSAAFETSNLKQLCSQQKFPYHWMGDNAYSISPTMLVPFICTFVGFQYESFNFYLSQLRVTIERAFGMLIQRWGIFWRKLKFDIPFILEIIHACCRLHNYCLKQNIPILNEGKDAPVLTPEGTLADSRWRSVDGLETGECFNALRDIIVSEIKDRELVRIRNISKK